jgi:hypothetical protein
MLINEGEFVKEMLLVKNGILSLEITLNINYDVFNSPHKIGLIQKLMTKKKIISNKLSTMTQRSIKIFQIHRNEHFGDVLMFLNRPSPLGVRVKSKMVELYMLRKFDFANIAHDFPDIYDKIYKISVAKMDKIHQLVDNTKKLFVHNQIEYIRTIQQVSNLKMYENIQHQQMSNSNKANNEAKSMRSFKDLENFENSKQECSDCEINSICPSINEEKKEVFIKSNNIDFKASTKISETECEIVNGYYSKDMDKFVILDGIVNGEKKSIKVQSVPWLKKLVQSTINFTIEGIDNKSKCVTRSYKVEFDNENQSDKKVAYHQIEDLFLSNKKFSISKHANITSLNQPDKIQQQIRQRDMLHKIEKNIIKSNMIIHDPENYYRKLLLKMFTVNVNKKKANLKNLRNMTRRLDSIETLLNGKKLEII